MLNEIRLAIASLAGAKTIAEGLVAERDARKVAEAVENLLEKITSARMTILSLQDSLEAKNDALATLQEEKRQLVALLQQKEERSMEFAGYELADVARGTFVYAPKPDEQGVRRQPYLCPTCKSQGKNSTLNFQKATEKTPTRLACPVTASHAVVLPRGGWTAANLGRSEDAAKQ